MRARDPAPLEVGEQEALVAATGAGALVAEGLAAVDLVAVEAAQAVGVLTACAVAATAPADHAVPVDLQAAKRLSVESGLVSDLLCKSSLL